MRMAVNITRVHRTYQPGLLYLARPLSLLYTHALEPGIPHKQFTSVTNTGTKQDYKVAGNNFNVRRFISSSHLLSTPHKDSHHRAVTHTLHNISIEKLSDPAVVKVFLSKLDDQAKDTVRTELIKLDESSHRQNDKRKPAAPSRSQILNVCMFSGVPFIAFGILDNMIMIVAGEYIDVTLGAAFGISTMAAAALGNMISDVAGVGTTGYVEQIVGKIGIQRPNITLEQSFMWQVRWTVGLGRALGIALGCFIGMFPLLFYDDEDSCEGSSEPDQIQGKSENMEKQK